MEQSLWVRVPLRASIIVRVRHFRLIGLILSKCWDLFFCASHPPNLLGTASAADLAASFGWTMKETPFLPCYATLRQLPRFAERFSHLTFDVGVLESASRHIVLNEYRNPFRPENPRITPIWECYPKMTESLVGPQKYSLHRDTHNPEAKMRRRQDA